MYRNEGPLLQYDRQLLKKGGVKTDGRTVLKFLAPELQAQLQRLELDYARKNKGANTTVLEIAKTIFECQVVSNKGYQWVVIDQRYRKPKMTASLVPTRSDVLAVAGTSLVPFLE